MSGTNLLRLLIDMNSERRILLSESVESLGKLRTLLSDGEESEGNDGLGNEHRGLDSEATSEGNKSRVSRRR